MVAKKFCFLAFTLGCLLFLSSIVAPAARAQATGTLEVATLNVESPRFCSGETIAETDPQIVRQRFEALAGPALWALSEVPDESAARTYAQAASYPGSDFRVIMGDNGTCSDKLAILYDRQRMSPVEVKELVREVGGDRDPLAVHFRLSDNTEFWAVANHFARGNTGSRNSQAENLRDWIELQTLPVVALGDFNMDYSVDNSLSNVRPSDCRGSIEQGNQAFRIFTSSQDISWIRPACLSDGSCPPEGTGCFLPCFNSILDFVFIGGPASSGWAGTSDIAFKAEGTYCTFDPQGDTDHRPVLATLTYPVGESPVVILPPPADSVRIVEIFPNPVGGSQVEAQSEAVTIRNFSRDTIDLTGWKLRDAANTTWDLFGSAGAGQNVEFRRNGQPMALSNDGDTIELLDATGNIVDFAEYRATSEGTAIAF